MTILFEESFVSGNLNNWQHQTLTGTPVGSMGVVNFPFIGTSPNSFRSIASPTTNLTDTRAEIGKDVALGELYVRAYVYITQGITAMAAMDRWYFIELLPPDGGTLVLAGIRKTSATAAPRWSIAYRYQQNADGTWVSTNFQGSSDINPAPRPICVELRKSSNTYELWIDGNLEISRTVTPTVALPNVVHARIGVYKRGGGTSPDIPPGAYTAEVYMDEIVFSDAYVGPIVAPPKPKLTVNSSPELNVPVYVDDQLAGNTPLMVELVTGTHTVRVEQQIPPSLQLRLPTVNSSSVNPSILLGDMTLTAYYEEVIVESLPFHDDFVDLSKWQVLKGAFVIK